ncbi:tetratricopeptide repeat protein [Streptomyces sp. NPDC015131]|uniref:tetratricopeptide repeat protein n=1 Tax=Streptomyces sp. NPDC015131 TaxID=3364941 RepID=UPI0037002455
MDGWLVYAGLALVLALWAGRQLMMRHQARRATGDEQPPFPIPDRPEPVLREAASQGDVGAMVELGELAVLRRDAAEALEWWTRALAAGSDLAAYRLGCLHHARGEADKAAPHYLRAARAGVPEAANDYAMFLFAQGDGSGHEWLRRAAESGDATAMYNLAVRAEGRGDLVEAERWSRRSADAGNPKGAYALGLLLHRRGDTEQAERWYLRAAEAQDRDAMYNLGNLLRERGELDGADHWYSRAARAGDADAAHNLTLLRRRRYGR